MASFTPNSSKHAPPLTSYTHSRTPKARSIGSLPLPLPAHSLRLTPTDSFAPSSHTSTFSTPDMRGIRSPSRLPATDCMSYFPPFESMGSASSSTSSSSASAGPSNHARKRSVRDKENSQGEHRPGHARGRSLGSLAGIMSFLSPGLTMNTTHQASQSTSSAGTSPAIIHSSSDGDVLQALTKRVTPGKRRVLEPMSLTNDGITQSLSAGMIAAHKRRMGSEVEVEGILGRRAVQRQSGSKLGEETDEEGLVEAIISDTPTMLRRRPRPHLAVPLAPLPNWSFPIPSPPVACLSPDIPLDAFTFPIDNPLVSAAPSREASPVNDTVPTQQLLLANQEEEDEVEDDLSPTVSSYASSSSNSRPSTPSRDHDDWITIKSVSPPDSLRTARPDDDEPIHRFSHPKLERTDSQFSSDSKETIRPEIMRDLEKRDKWREAEATPKANRVMGGVGSRAVV